MEHVRSGWERWLAVTGFAYVILHFVYFASMAADPGGTVGAATRAFLRNPTQGALGGTIGQVVALILLLFVLSLRAYLRQGEDEPKTLSSLMLVAATCSVVLTFVGSACIFIDAHAVAKLGDPNLTYAALHLWWATFMGSAVMTGIVVAAASTLGLTTKLFPRWIGWLGIACGLGLAGSALAFYPTGGVIEGPADSVAYIAENLMILWTIAASIVILRGRRVARQSTQATLRAEGAAV